jgi:hypothetical protein
MPSDTRRNRIGAGAWLAAMAAVIVGELLPATSEPIVLIGELGVSDKVIHFAAYALLAFIPVLAFRLRTGLLCAVAMIALGVALEFAQRLSPGRMFEVADMVANALGVLAGAAAALAARALTRSA